MKDTPDNFIAVAMLIYTCVLPSATMFLLIECAVVGIEVDTESEQRILAEDQPSVYQGSTPRALH